MPWFIYNYPNDATQPGSYTLSTGTPSCTGNTLCAIYAPTQPNSIPARPVINTQLSNSIQQAINGTITEGVTLLRPE